jgi:hypothetical protein
MKRDSRAPLIVAIVLLLLPLLYVGSYLAMVVPSGDGGIRIPGLAGDEYYRFGGERAAWYFWPLEQIDRKVRPGAWESLEIETIPLNSR